MISIVLAFWTKWRWWVLGGGVLALLAFTNYRTWSATRAACELRTLKETVKDEKTLHKIRNNRPDDAALIDSLRKGKF